MGRYWGLESNHGDENQLYPSDLEQDKGDANVTNAEEGIDENINQVIIKRYLSPRQTRNLKIKGVRVDIPL